MNSPIRAKLYARAAALCSMLASSLGVVSPVQAHHSTAQYDMTRRITFNGTVKRFDYQNPHAWIWIDVSQSGAAPQEIGIECGSPAMLRHNGLAWDALKPGDKVMIEASPFKDSQRTGGILVAVTWADGHKWGGKGPFAQGPAGPADANPPPNTTP